MIPARTRISSRRSSRSPASAISECGSEPVGGCVADIVDILDDLGPVSASDDAMADTSSSSAAADEPSRGTFRPTSI